LRDRTIAKGRFLDKRTARDERVAEVSLRAKDLDLALTPFADVDGKLSGNVTLVKADTCPLRAEMTEKVIGKCLQELHGVGLIEWYNAEGRKVVRIRDFDRYQQGLRRDRENPSELPDLDGGKMSDQIPQNDDIDPAQVQGKGKGKGQVEVEGEVEEKEKGEEEEKYKMDHFDLLFQTEDDDGGSLQGSPPSSGCTSWKYRMTTRINKL